MDKSDAKCGRVGPLKSQLIGAIVLTLCAIDRGRGEDYAKMDRARMEAVVRFGETVLAHGRDKYGEKHTPLFTETLDVDTLSAPDRIYIFRLNKPSPRQWQPWQPVVSSNVAFQGNLMRVLVGLSNLTGESRFKGAYQESIRYYFAHYQNQSGLLHTGHHRFIDLKADRYDGDDWPPGSRGHEMKGDMPWYDIFWETDREATRRMLDGHWNSHIKNWDSMNFTRHGYYHKILGSGVWERSMGNPVHGIIRGDLTFFDSCTDIAWAGGKRSLLSGDDRPRQWTRRLLARYIDNVHQNTGLPPCHHTMVRDFASANGYPGESWPEYAILSSSPSESMFAYGATMLLRLADQFGKEKGAYFRDSVRDYLKAYAKHAYHAGDNSLRAILNDGRSLSDKVRLHTPTRELLFPPWQAHPGYMLSYALCYRLTGDNDILNTLRAICRGHDLGEIGVAEGVSAELNWKTDHSDPRTIFAMIELFRGTEDGAFLNLARVVANNAFNERFNAEKGLFVASELHKNACLNVVEPLAFLRLEAAIQDRLDEVPTYDGSTLGNVFDILRPTKTLPFHPTVSHRWYPTTELAMCDELIPKSSNDSGVPRFSWYRGKHKKSAVAVFPNILKASVEIKSPSDAPDSPRLLQGITIDSPFTYRFAPPGGLQMQEDFTLSVLQGEHEWLEGMAWYPSKNANYIFDIAAESQFTFSSVIYEYYYPQHRSGLIKNGDGVLVLTADNTQLLKDRIEDNRAHTGDTVINAGRLLVNNSNGSGISPRSVVHVRDGGTLGGNGVIGTGGTSALVNVHAGGTIAAGSDEGGLTFRDGLTLHKGAILSFDLTNDDQVLKVSGKTLTGGDEANVRVRIAESGSIQVGQTFDLIDWTGATSVGVAAKNFVIDKTSHFAGTFSVKDNRLRITITEAVENVSHNSTRLSKPTPPTKTSETIFTWANPRGGKWSDSANWSEKIVPNGRPQEWAQYTFTEPRKLSNVAVYWLDDGGSNRVPMAWRVIYRAGDKWQAVETANEYGVAKDQFNTVHFHPIETNALRLIVLPQEEHSAGVLEWRVMP